MSAALDDTAITRLCGPLIDIADGYLSFVDLMNKIEPSQPESAFASIPTWSFETRTILAQTQDTRLLS